MFLSVSVLCAFFLLFMCTYLLLWCVLLKVCLFAKGAASDAKAKATS